MAAYLTRPAPACPRHPSPRDGCSEVHGAKQAEAEIKVEFSRLLQISP